MPTTTAPARHRRASSVDSTRASSSRDDKHERNRAAILQVSRRLFFAHGFSGVTMDDIAGELGMTKPYVYYYFKSAKSEIFATLCLNAADATLTSFKFSWDEDTPVLEVLHEGFRRLAMANMEHFEASCLYYREPHAVSPAARRKILARARTFYQGIRDLIERGQSQGVLVPGINPAVAALSISGVIGFMYRWYDPEGPFSREQMADELVAGMLRLAGVPTSLDRGGARASKKRASR